ncbi:hypothetical protein M5585_25075 [Serratia ureilytica]
MSAHYLRYAEQGVFATPLHALAQGLRAPEEVSAAVAAVLSLGTFRERTRCWACGWG